jgi:16S rRNA (guanine527-N7)-methyltransferase
VTEHPLREDSGVSVSPGSLPVRQLLSDALFVPATAPADHAARSVELLIAYTEDLYSANPSYSLVSADDAADLSTLAIRHILDSTAGAPVVAEALRDHGTRTLIDLGSGAGLPGIPLGVVLRDELDHCILVERKERRVRFLASATSRLVLPCLRVLQTDAERPGSEAAVELRTDPPPVVVFRAYRPVTGEMLRKLGHLFPRGATVIAWKGRVESAAREAEIIRDAPGARFHGISPLTVPHLNHERCLLIFSVGLG